MKKGESDEMLRPTDSGGRWSRISLLPTKIRGWFGGDTGDNVVGGHSAESLRMRAEGRRELLTSLMKAQAILNIQPKWRATRSILFEICVSVQKGQANYASRNGPARYSTLESLLS